jgi:hypothetical protein
VADDEAAALVAAALNFIRGHRNSHSRDFGWAPAVRAICAAPDEVRRRCIVLAAREEPWDSYTWLLSPIARVPAGMSLEEIESVLPAPGSRFAGQEEMRRRTQLSCLVGQVEATWAALDDDGKARLLPRLDWAARIADPYAATRLCQLAIACADEGGEVPYCLIDDASPVGKDLVAVLVASPEPDRVKARLIRVLAAYPHDGKPGRIWRDNARSVREALCGPAIVSALLDAALNAPDHHYQVGYHSVTGPIRAVGIGSIKNEPALCGLAVLAGQLAAAEPGLLPGLRRMVLRSSAGRSDTGIHPGIRLAGLAVHAIADTAQPASLTELLKAERGTRHGTLLRQIRKSIDALASAQGLTRDQLLERTVEEHGLDADGTSRRSLAGSWLAVIQAGPRTVAVGYEDPDGKPRKSLPPAVKNDSADALTAIRADLKALRTTVGNERARLDALLSAQRSWPVAQWRELYLDHPVTGRLTRALIWQFRTGGTGAWAGGIPTAESALVTSDGTELPIPAGDDAEVRLWHPVHVGADEVRAWRQLLLDRQVVQPVKQAFREVYVLTPAEAQTLDHSNRFAGHIFRQEQARALMKGRSWAPVPLAAWDDGIDHGIARRHYPRAGGQAGLHAEFLFEPADDQDFNQQGMYTYCASDQVRFSHAGTGDPVSLAEVPPVIFSEAMRDVDLVIGVTSIGADPEWPNRGERGRFEQYWQHWSFGDLGAGAPVRHEVLAGLLPMLAIAERCELTGRFLVVRGDLRTYKIHLGSGNVRTATDDRYLCIVAVRDTRVGRLFLPFDDDPLLSLILSKAFLLADDANITDPSIVGQVGGRPPGV